MNTRTSTKAAFSSSSDSPVAQRARVKKPVARFRMRVTSGEAIAVGPGKIALLEAIQKTHSITAAAKSIHMSYRRAWMLVDELNGALKKPAVSSANGGKDGGGSHLTEVGLALVTVYRHIEEQATQACADDIDRLVKLVK
jgi:molybdate transport system regulatory protein